MAAQGFAMFDTAVGRCAIAWSERGITGVQLPERDDAATRARLLKGNAVARESPPPPEVARAIDDIVALIRGERRDLSAIVLDMEGVSAFNRRVYEVARTIAPGTTRTYGSIATQLGAPDPRGVGEALGQNPIPIIVPCHRVVAASHKAGGFSAPGGVATKLRLLAIEGARLDDAPTLFDREGGLRYDVGGRSGKRTRRSTRQIKQI
jgi:methylated-DNA-[protein]-cysteine S-methyltransferase